MENKKSIQYSPPVEILMFPSYKTELNPEVISTNNHNKHCIIITEILKNEG